MGDKTKENYGLIEATGLKKWLEINFEGEKSALHNISFKVFNLFIEIIEDIIGKQLYIQCSNLEFKLGSHLKKLKNQIVSYGFLENYRLADYYPDEPKAFIVSGKLGKLSKTKNVLISSNPVGADFFDINKAMMRCFGEAIERSCLCNYDEKKIYFKSFKELDRSAVDPNTITAFSKYQLEKKEFSKFKITAVDVFGWVKGISLLNQRNIFVPAQIIFLPYGGSHKEEKTIRYAISTGAAAHTDKYEALYRSLCEVIERDAFMIFYLNSITPPSLDLERCNDEDIKKILRTFKRYNLELHVVEITTDIPVPTFATLIIDRTGIGPAVVLSTKTGLDKRETIIGSISEAYKSWRARRRKLEAKPEIDKIKSRANEIYEQTDRALLWSKLDMIPNIEFLMKGEKKEIELEYVPERSIDRLEKVLKFFKDSNLEVVSLDISIKEARDLGFYAFMILVPELQPLYLNEKFPYFGGKRLYDVPVRLSYFNNPKKESDLNKIPHPHV